MRLLIIGPPGAGKGSLAEVICREHGLLHISTGEMFRRNIKEKTPLGLEASAYINQDKLVPDEVTNAMVRDLLLNQVREQGFLLDGYPRKISQAEALESYLQEMHVKLDAVIEVELSDETIIERLSGRRSCPQCGATYHKQYRPPVDEGHCDHCATAIIQRADDKSETVAARLQIYHSETSPLLTYYKKQNLLYSVDNSGPIQQAEAALRSIFEDLS